MSQIEARVAALINRLSDKELMEFKVGFLGRLGMPREIARHPYFSATNISRWVFVANRYEDYIRHLLSKSGHEGHKHVTSSNKASTSTKPSTFLEKLNNVDGQVIIGASPLSPSSVLWTIPSHASDTDGQVHREESSPTLGKRKRDPNTQEDAQQSHVFLGVIDMSADSDDEVNKHVHLPVKKVINKKKRILHHPSPPPQESIDANGRLVIDLTTL